MKDDQRWSSFFLWHKACLTAAISNLVSMSEMISSKEDAMKVAVLTNLRMWGFRLIYQEVYKMYDFFCTLDFPISADLAKRKYLISLSSRK